MDTTRFVVLSNFLRTGLVEFLSLQPDRAATLDQIVAFYLTSATPPTAEDATLLQQYCQQTDTPGKSGFVEYLAQRVSWLNARSVNFPLPFPETENADWNPFLRSLHEQFDPQFPGRDETRTQMAREHWHRFLVMADAFGIVRYQSDRIQLSERALAKLQKELRLFGDGYCGIDDLLGVLLKVEALRGETGWMVRPPPFMLETCDALARRIGIPSYWQFSPRLAAGGCRVLDLGCGSGIYSNAFAGKNNQCVAIDRTPWVFLRAFLGARAGVQAVCSDMNSLPASVTQKPFTHVISNIAAHHFRNRPALFRQLGERLDPSGEICILNFNYSLHDKSLWNPIAGIKRRFAAQIQYNWSVLEFDRGGVDFISPDDIARDLESAGFSATVHPCDPLRELFFVRGLKQNP